jgi:uncharacterized protein YijF (DUF1287 family)
MRRRDFVLFSAAGFATLSRASHTWAEGLAPDRKSQGVRIADAAAAQHGVTLFYDPSYVRLDYPMGDVPMERGVCADVVIRALRSCGHDLQATVHTDMKAHFSAYPRTWGLKAPDKNIDHRRVLNLETYFRRKGGALTGGNDGLRAGDLVTWRLPGSLPHIGIVGTQTTRDRARPLIVHNVGAGVQIEDVLEAWPVVGRFRFPVTL